MSNLSTEYNVPTMHTPGPWRYEPTRDNSATSRQMIDEPIGGSIMAGDTYLARIWSDGENPMADACLMAAAPDLLAALKEMLECYDVPRAACNHARAAIDKAEGRE